MSRRADPERIHQARRAATVERLVQQERQLRDRVEALVARWEASAAAEGLPHDRSYWEAFDAWRATQQRRG